MDLRRSTTVLVLGVVGVVLGAVGLVSLGWLVGAAALAVVVVVALAGFWLERDRGLHDVLRFKPVAIGELDAIRCGVDKTAPWLLEKTDARDGEHLLSFVSRAEARELGRKLARAIADERSAVVALIGESKAGKTRCVFEVLRMRVPRAVVFAPRRKPEALREVVGHRRFRSGKHWSVLWLDDLEAFLDLTGERGVDDELLDELLALPRVVVAITAGARWGIERLADAPSLARLTLEAGEDGNRIASVFGHALADAVGCEGLGAACVAGPELLDIHDSGRHPKSESAQAVPEGAIVVECLIAAASWAWDR